MAWVDNVMSYIESSFRGIQEATATAAAGEAANAAACTSAMSTTADVTVVVTGAINPPASIRSLLDVFGRILLQNDDIFYQAKRWPLMIEAYRAAFFSYSNSESKIRNTSDNDGNANAGASVSTNGVDVSLARSSSARRAVVLARELFSTCDFEIGTAQEKLGNALVASVLGSLPYYLYAWGSDYVSESRAVVEFLHHMVRRVQNPTASSSEPWLAQLRRGLEALVQPVLDHSPGRTGNNKGSCVPVVSLLECYPPQLQRHALSLLVMLRQPTAPTMTGLGKICARSHCFRAAATASSTVGKGESSFVMSTDMATYIVKSMHSIRKSVSIQSFVSFLFNSTGLMSLDESMIRQEKHADEGTAGSSWSFEALLELDAGIQDACISLIDCGSSRVLPMLQPLLLVWLKGNQTNADNGSSTVTAKGSVQSRAALTILAMFSLDIASSYNKLGNVEHEDDFACASSIFSALPDGSFEESVVDAVCRFFYCAPTVKETQENVVQAWIRPVLVFLCSEPASLFQKIFATLTSKIDAFDGRTQSRTLQILLIAVKDPRFASAIVKSRREVVDQTKSLNARLSGGHLESIASRLLVEVELLQQ